MSVIDIPLHDRGFVYNLPRTNIPFGSMKKGSFNINFFKEGKGKRAGTSQHTTGYSGTTKSITGLCQFTDSSGNEFLIVATSDGKFWSDDSTEITPTGGAWTVDTLVNFHVRGTTVYACNGKDPPVRWKGSGLMTDLANIPTDWTGTNYPKWIMSHAPGSQANIVAGTTIAGSNRLYAGGCAGNKYTVYVSTAYDPGTAASEDDFSDANVHLLYIDTRDSSGLVACHKFGARLMFFGTDETHILDDSDATLTNWGTYKARWNAGTISQRTACNNPEGDLFIFTSDGHLYQASTSDKYADYLSASVSQPFYMNEYFKDNYNLNETVHLQWNDIETSVTIFFATLASSKYRAHSYNTNENAWSSPLYNDNYDSGYKSKASCIFRNSDGSRQIVTGDDKSYTWKLNVRDSISDNGNGYPALMQLSDITISEDYSKAELKVLSMLTNEELGASFKYNMIIDSGTLHSGTVASVDATIVLGSFVLGSSVLGGREINYRKVHKGGRGRIISLSFETTSDTSDMRFVRLSLVIKELRSY